MALSRLSSKLNWGSGRLPFDETHSIDLGRRLQSEIYKFSRRSRTNTFSLGNSQVEKWSKNEVISILFILRSRIGIRALRSALSSMTGRSYLKRVGRKNRKAYIVPI